MSTQQDILGWLRDHPESTAAEVAKAIPEIADGDEAAQRLYALHKTGKVLRGTIKPYRYVLADDAGLTDVSSASTAPAQPEVAVNNTGSSRPELDGAQSSAGAAAAAKHAPQGHPCGAASSTPDITVSIDSTGRVLIATCEGEIELDAEQTLALGDFLHATQGVWRP